MFIYLPHLNEKNSFFSQAYWPSILATLLTLHIYSTFIIFKHTLSNKLAKLHRLLIAFYYSSVEPIRIKVNDRINYIFASILIIFKRLLYNQTLVYYLTFQSLAVTSYFPILNLDNIYITLDFVKWPASTNIYVASFPKLLFIISCPPGCCPIYALKSYTAPNNTTIVLWSPIIFFIF